MNFLSGVKGIIENIKNSITKPTVSPYNRSGTGANYIKNLAVGNNSSDSFREDNSFRGSGYSGDYTDPMDNIVSDLPTSSGNIDSLNQEGVAARQWQEFMSNTSHQREVADLKAAGLNPVLSANNGASAYQASSGADSMDIAKVQAATNLKTAQMAMNSAQAVAGINAASNLAVAKLYNETSANNAELDFVGRIINSGINLLAGSVLGKKSSYAGVNTNYNTSTNLNKNYNHAIIDHVYR